MTEKKLPSLYSLTQIGIATFLGSSLAAGYMLASNYAALGQRRMAIYSLWGSLGLVLAFILLPGQLSTNAAIAIGIMIGQVVLVLAIANKLQGPMFASFEEMGGQYFPMWRTIVVGIGASFVLVFVWILFVSLFGGDLPQAPTPANGTAPTL
ncbi:MAG: hypothetical protein ACFHXK_20140 [bacterium]